MNRLSPKNIFREFRLGWTSWLALFALSVSLGAAYPQEKPALTDDQVRERLSDIENALGSAQPRAKTWWYG
ncbi:MAG: hypothetical protein JXE07_00345, partial [Candidatus Aminicenantes bacterium]|nr:hypothetical protein [Candidatus Aminicenantes bacterium]